MKSDAEPAGASELEKGAIAEELERVLAHPLFRNSVRCQTLLRFVVMQDLQGKSSQLKERLLGIEVFGRKADYDLNQDPVVRAAASEVRKKLAQYYQEEGHEGEIGIHLPAGSYVPKFQWPDKMPNSDPATGSVFATVFSSRAAKLSALVFLIFVVVVVALIVFVQWPHWRLAEDSSRITTIQSADERFWAPVLASKERISICVAAPKQSTSDSTLFSGYAFSLARLGEYLGKRGHHFNFESSASLSFANLKDEPTIRIGQFVDGNSWPMDAITGSAETTKQANPSRYSWGRDNVAGVVWINDPENPGRQWSIESEKPASKPTQDFAILAQFNRKNNFSIVVAGLGANGTIGAINCLVDASCMEQVYSALPKTAGLENGDLEAVLRIPILDGTPQLAQVVGVKLIPRQEGLQ